MSLALSSFFAARWILHRLSLESCPVPLSRQCEIHPSGAAYLSCARDLIRGISRTPRICDSMKCQKGNAGEDALPLCHYFLGISGSILRSTRCVLAEQARTHLSCAAQQTFTSRCQIAKDVESSFAFSGWDDNLDLLYCPSLAHASFNDDHVTSKSKNGAASRRNLIADV